jgi:putative ABC transport system permease protein
MKINLEMIEDLQTRKFLRDLWGNKIRTGLVILTIAVGVFAVGAIARSWVILSNNLTNNYVAVNPASATITTSRPFDDSFVDSVSRMPEIATAEGRNNLGVRVKVGADRWHLLRLIVRADYDQLNLDKIQTETGDWPPPRHSMLLERSSLNLVKLNIGDTAVIRLPDGKLDEISVAGVMISPKPRPTLLIQPTAM